MLRLAGWGVTVAALALYAAMLTVTLPHLQQLAGGLVPFDLRPGGYDAETANRLVEALGRTGADYYENVQHRLDFFYPVLLGLTLIWWGRAASRRWQARGLRFGRSLMVVLVVGAILGTACDLSENLMVSRMLSAPLPLEADLVGWASAFTLSKAIANTLTMSLLLVLALGPTVEFIWRRLQGTRT